MLQHFLPSDDWVKADVSTSLTVTSFMTENRKIALLLRFFLSFFGVMAEDNSPSRTSWIRFTCLTHVFTAEAECLNIPSWAVSYKGRLQVMNLKTWTKKLVSHVNNDYLVFHRIISSTPLSLTEPSVTKGQRGSLQLFFSNPVCCVDLDCSRLFAGCLVKIWILHMKKSFLTL